MEHDTLLRVFPKPKFQRDPFHLTIAFQKLNNIFHRLTDQSDGIDRLKIRLHENSEGKFE